MKVAIIMGSKSDYDVVKKAEAVLDTFGIEYVTRVISAHRTPAVAEHFSKTAKEEGFDIIIARG